MTFSPILQEGKDFRFGSDGAVGSPGVQLAFKQTLATQAFASGVQLHILGCRQAVASSQHKSKSEKDRLMQASRQSALLLFVRVSGNMRHCGEEPRFLQPRGVGTKLDDGTSGKSSTGGPSPPCRTGFVHNCIGLQSGVLAHSEVAVGFDPSVEWAVEPS